jgi:hypothetical protein
VKRDDLIALLEARVEVAATRIAESRARQANQLTEHQSWREAMQKQRQKSEAARLGRMGVHGAKRGYFEKDRFHPRDSDPPKESEK